MQPGDWERIADHLGVAPDKAGHLFERGNGVVLGNAATGQMVRIPTIRPRFRDTGRCVFLTEDRRCSIHPVAPAGCAFHDMHASIRESNRRTLWFMRRVQDDATYRAHWRALPDPEVKRDDYE